MNKPTDSSRSVPRKVLAEGAASFSPLYRQIKTLIEQRLDEGEWKPGESIPSETELATRFKVSQGTVRKAIDELTAENLVVRHQGKGTFVSTHHEAHAQFRFLRLVPDEGEPYHPESRILECQRLRAPDDIAALLDLKTGASVILIKRVLIFEQVPKVFDEIWLPAALFKGLTLDTFAMHSAPLYALFETDFGVRMIRAREKIRAVAADPAVAEILGVAPDTALLSVERVAMTYGERPVEVRRGLYVTSGHFYKNELG